MKFFNILLSCINIVCSSVIIVIMIQKLKGEKQDAK
jgi:preprotein translocase subunit SecG